MTEEIKTALQFLSQPEKTQFCPLFFKSGPGEDAEAGEVIGVTVPDQRKIAKAYFQKI